MTYVLYTREFSAISSPDGEKRNIAWVTARESGMTVPGGVLARGLVLWPEEDYRTLLEGEFASLMGVEFFGAEEHMRSDLKVALHVMASLVGIGAKAAYADHEESGAWNDGMVFAPSWIDTTLDDEGKTVYVFAFRESRAAELAHKAGYRTWESTAVAPWHALRKLEE